MPGLVPLDSDWLERLERQKPWGFQHFDPSREFASLYASSPDSEQRAGVWDLRTGRIAWAPEGAQAIRWNAGGDEILVVGAEGTGGFDGWLRRYTWPERSLLGGGGIELPGYLFDDLAISPAAPVVAVSAIDQSETFVDLYHTATAESPPTPIARWMERKGNLVNGLEFNPTGSSLVWTLGGGYYWWTRNDLPSTSEGGSFDLGTICLWRIQGDVPRGVRSIQVLVNLPAGWSPEEPEKIQLAQMMYGPVFEGERAFRVLLPTGEWRRYDLELQEITAKGSQEKTRVSDVAFVDLRAARR